MGLKGQLEDLSLVDMIQITAFSKKSGCLRVAAPPGRGAIYLREGRVLFAYSWSTLESLRALAAAPAPVTSGALREHVEASLRELAGLREGTFEFESARALGREVEGIPLDSLPLDSGFDPQELLLDLAVELDNERREATDLGELAFQGPLEEDVDLGEEELASLVEPSGDAPATTKAVPDAPARPLCVVLVDDETPVREIVGRELRQSGRQVFLASSPDEGVALVRACLERGEDVLLAVDLKMPTTSGRSFYGGFELIRRASEVAGSVPVLLMVESVSDRARTAARKLGVRRVVHKPTLTKPDPDLYRADLVEFASVVHGQLDKLCEDRAHAQTGERTEANVGRA